MEELYNISHINRDAHLFYFSGKKAQFAIPNVRYQDQTHLIHVHMNEALNAAGADVIIFTPL